MRNFDNVLKYGNIEIKLFYTAKHTKEWYEHSVKVVYDLWIVLDGEIEMIFNGKKNILKKGDLFVFFPNMPYTASCLTDSCSFIYIYFDFKVGINNKILNMFDINGMFPYGDIKKEIDLLIEAFERYCKTEPFYFFGLKGYVGVLLAKLLELCEIQQFNRSNNSSATKPLARLRPALDYISAHLNTAIKVKVLADLSYLSEKYFNSLFKNTLGMPPAKYISDLKLTKALELIHEAKYSVKDIANMLGYYDQHAFSKAFKNKYKISPSFIVKKNKNRTNSK